MARYSLIAAVGDNLEIGYNGCLPWTLSADMRHFKEITMGHTIIMGRKTWDSLSVKPLPSRRNIVLTSHPQLIANYAETATNLDALFKLLQDSNDEVFIIGGAELFSLFIEIADRLKV